MLSRVVRSLRLSVDAAVSRLAGALHRSCCVPGRPGCCTPRKTYVHIKFASTSLPSLVMEEQPGLPELLPGLIEAVTTVARLDLPDTADIYYYRNMPEYKEINTACSCQIEQLLRSAHTNLTRPSAASAADVLELHDEDDLEEALYESVVSILDDTMERLDTALDAAKQQTEHFKLGGWAPATGSRQIFRAIARGLDHPGAAAGFSRGRIQRHVANLPRPQDVFPEPVDNSNTPWSPSKFSHLSPKLAAAAAAQSHRDRLQAHAAQLAAAGRANSSGTASTGHPYAAELSALSYQSWQVEAPCELTAAADVDDTPFEFINTPDQLAAMVDALRGERQIALDLEHHSYRSFQGFSCLLQLSTRSHDYVVDCLSLRSQLGPALADILADPAVEKVLHGADSDVLWLQRDFGLYIVNLFDTGQATRVLYYPSASLAYLLERHAGFKADKRYQLADWRVRPLSADMLHYARCDTHFLLPVADQLKKELIAAGDRAPAGWSITVPHTAGTGQTALGVVLERSRQICLQTYQKPLFTEHSYLEQAARWQLNFPPKNMAVFAALFAWRDRTARALDESVSYVMPKASLIELSRAAPQTVAELRKLLGAASGLSGSSGLLLQRADEVVQVIVSGQQQASLPVARPAAAAEASSSPLTAAAGAAAAAEVAQAPVKPRELPALKPKSVAALAPKKASGMKGILGAGRQPGVAAAAVPIAVPPAPTGTGLQPAHTDALQQPPGQQSGQAKPLDQHQSQQQQQAAVNVVPVDGAVQQQLQQHSEVQQAQPSNKQQQQQLAQAFPATAPLKQVAAVISKKRSGSSLAGLLSSKPRLNRAAPQQQQQTPEQQAAGIKATSFRLPFMATATAGSAAAVESGRLQSVAHDSSMQQQQPQAAESAVAEAPAAAVTGAEIRAVVDQLTAEADDDTQQQQQQQQQQSLEEDSEEQVANCGSGNALADLDYVPLSAQIQKKKNYHNKKDIGTQRQQQPDKQQQAPVNDQQPAAQGNIINRGTQPAAAAPGVQVHTQRKKGGIFADAMLADSDDNSSSDDGSDDGLLPSYDPSGTKKPVSAAQDGQLQHGRSTALEANHFVDQGNVPGKGRGQRGGRGDRGRGRSKRGGFMAAATASLAAVRAKQGGRGVGANPFAIPNTGLVRGGKRSAVAPRGGNRSATFK